MIMLMTRITISWLSHWILRHKLYAVTAIVFAGLTALSIYNGYWVLYAYYNDNIITTTNVKTSRNIYPFSQHLSVSYFFTNNTIFPETWGFSDRKLQKLLPPDDYQPGAWYVSKRLERRREKKVFYAGSKMDITLENAVDIATMTDAISYFDNKFLVGFTKHEIFGEHVQNREAFVGFFQNASLRLPALTDRFYHVPKLELSPEVSKVVDAFIANPYADQLVDRTLSRIIKPDFVHLIRPVLPNMSHVPVTYTVDLLTYRSVQFVIPLEFVENVTTSTIELEIMPFDQQNRPPPLLQVQQSFSPFKVPGIIGMNLMAPAPALNSPILKTSIYFQNTGIYNFTDIRSDEECARCANLTSVEHCLYKCLLDSIVDSCQCIPFTYRRLYRDDPKRQSLPYCTLKKYGSCAQRIVYDPGECPEQGVIPCETHEYSRSTEVEGANIPNGTEENSVYRMHFTITCAKSTFVVFQEKFKSSWMEMLGELGGNLGIFLEFSLFGLWRGFVIIYLAYRRKKKARRNTKPSSIDPDPMTFASTWIQLARMSMHGSEASQEKESERDKQIETLVQKIEKLGANYENTREESDRAKEKLEAENRELKKKLEKEREEQREASQDLERRLKILEENIGKWGPGNKMEQTGSEIERPASRKTGRSITWTEFS